MTSIDVKEEIERLSALPLDERAAGLARLVERLESDLEAQQGPSPETPQDEPGVG